MRLMLQWSGNNAMNVVYRLILDLGKQGQISKYTYIYAYRPYAIPHVTKRKMDSGWKSGYYAAILSGKKGCGTYTP